MNCSNESSSKTPAARRPGWWVTVLLVWVAITVPAVLAVWFLVKPAYTAVAQVQGFPSPDINPRFQARLVSSDQVLKAALADESVKSLPLLKEPAPLSALRACLKVEPLPDAQIVQISVTRQTAAEAVALAKAVADAYLYRVSENKEKDEREKRRILEAEQKRLRELVKSKRDEMLKLANESGLQTKQNIEAVELEILQLKDQIKQIEDGSYTGLLPDETIARKQEIIENDPIVRSLREELLSASAKLARLKSELTDEAKEVVRTREQIEGLKADLEKERIRAAADLDKVMTKDSILARMKRQLAAAERRRDELKKLVAEEEEAKRRIDRRSIEIQALREEIDRMNKDLGQIERAIERLNIESHRPGRIATASDPEVLVHDNRLKLSLAAAVAALLPAVVVADWRHRTCRRVPVKGVSDGQAATA